MLIHDKCKAWEVRIEQLEKELKKYKKQTARLEVILGITYMVFCTIFAIVVALHTPIGY